VDELIYQDIHEPLSMKVQLEKRGMKVEQKKLNIGDYAFGEYRIERKEVNDFMNSIYKRRLFDQLYNMQQVEKPVLIIVGEIPPSVQWMRVGKKKIPRALTFEEKCKRYNTIRKTLVTAYTSYNVQVFHATDEDDFADYVADLYYHSTKKGEKLRPLKRKSKSLKNIKIDMIGSIPGIGPKLAEQLASKYTISRLCSIKLKQLLKEKGIGIKTAKKIKECVTK